MAEEKTRAAQIDQLIRILEIQGRIKRDGALFKIRRALRFSGTRVEEVVPPKKKQEIEKKSSKELAEEIEKGKKKLKGIVSRMEKSSRKTVARDKKIREIYKLVGELEAPKRKPAPKKPAKPIQREPERVEIIRVHLAAKHPRKKKPKKKKGGKLLERILGRLGRRKKAPKIKLPEEAPKEVKEALEEYTRKKSKIEMMVKAKGPGWHGDRMRHQQASLKAWETRRQKELASLEKKEKEKGLSKEEKKVKESLGSEMTGIAKAIKDIEGHLKEIEMQRVSGKTAEVSIAVMKEARIAAEKAAEAAKAMPKYAATPAPPVQIILGEIKKAEQVGDIDQEIKHYKNLMKRVEYDYLKRHISEEEYRERRGEYQQRLAELEERTKIASEEKGVAAKPTAITLPAAAGKVAVPAGKPGAITVPVGKPSVAKPAAEAAQEALPPKAIKRLEKGTPPEVTHEKVAEIEKHIADLLKRYKIPRSEIEKEFGSLDSGRIVQDFDKLINLIELEKAAKTMKEKEEEAEEKVPLPLTAQKKEKIKAMAKDIKKYRIVTDFDRVLNYVREKGKVTADGARKELGMEKKRFKECCDVLEESGLLKIKYPAIGKMKLVDANYKEEKKKKKGMLWLKKPKKQT